MSPAPATLRRAQSVRLEALPATAVPGEPAFVTAVRTDAAAWLATHGYPGQHHEDWRYDDLRALLDQPYDDAGWSRPWRELSAMLAYDLGGPRLVFVNGRFDPDLSSGEGLPEGVVVTSVSDALRGGADELVRLWRAPSGGYRHAFEALDVARSLDGALVVVPDGAAAATPIELVHVQIADDAAPASTYRSLVVAGERATATIVETYLGNGTVASLTNAFTEVSLGDGAVVDHYKIQDESPRAFHLSSLDVLAGRRSRFRSRLLALGGRLARHEVRARLVGEGAAVDLSGLFLPTGSQCHDNPILVEHVAEDCASRQLYKGIVDGAARGVFNGHVVVHPGANGTDAHQTNKNLLLSDRAEVDTRPRLEIFADDVACTHGAAVGQLDADALFYLRSRGIPEPVARAVLVSGFAREVLCDFGPAAIRRRVDELVAHHLRATTGADDTGPLGLDDGELLVALGDEGLGDEGLGDEGPTGGSRR